MSTYRADESEILPLNHTFFDPMLSVHLPNCWEEKAISRIEQKSVYSIDRLVNFILTFGIMKNLRLMTYNVQDIHDLFDKEQKSIDTDIKSQNRFDALMRNIDNIQPNLLGMVEGPPHNWENEYIADALKCKEYKPVIRAKTHRGKQSLVMFYTQELELLNLDSDAEFYSEWKSDIDDDGIDEVMSFERVPMEAEFRVKETRQKFLVILVSLKSKYVSKAVDLQHYQRLQLANRKKNLAQAKKIRERLDSLLEHKSELPVILMGDINDSPELDSFEKYIGISALEVIMGSGFSPR